MLDYRDKPNRQMCRLYLSMMDKMNVRLDKFGDATEPLARSESNRTTKKSGLALYRGPACAGPYGP